MISLRTVTVTRYITPLREGGSLPALVEADDGELYVLKFRGAGQGAKALVAELLAGEIARVLGLRLPELVFANLDPAMARTEPDPEIQALLRASAGRNLALLYLPGATTFDPLVDYVDEALASRIVWFDCLVTNVDRTARNTNLLTWLSHLYLIDHGAALYFHHAGQDWQEASQRPFAQVKDHVLLFRATRLAEADAELRPKLTPDLLDAITGMVPDEWLTTPTETPADQRAVYRNFLQARLDASAVFVNAAHHARLARL
jgi:hypothetical protein